ncbi:MAG: hypothetical protein M3405_15505 [Acidobacteriota bacterium]|nr:hypothetical protein [Acidobacteriota bacterium]
MNNLRVILFLILILSVVSIVNAQDFNDAQEALSALNKMTECKCDTDKRAYKYFTSHPEESIPILISFTITNEQRAFISIRALSKIKDERVSNFLILLVSNELQNNPNSLISGTIAILGNYGDKSAIPVIKESLSRLNNNSRDVDEEALCKLGEISIDELFELRSKSKDKMLSIALSNEWVNPQFSIKMYDWIIEKIPKDKEMIYNSQKGKVSALYNLGKYELVLEKCEIIRNSFPEKIQNTTFSFEHRGFRFDEFVNFVKSKLTSNKK